MKSYNHEFSREIKNLDRLLMDYFGFEKKDLNKNEKHFINLLKLQFIYEVELKKERGNCSNAIFKVIQKNRIYFNDDFKIENNKFYLITNTEIKKYIQNKYKFKLVSTDAVKRKHVYGGDYKYYQLIKIHSKIIN